MSAAPALLTGRSCSIPGFNFFASFQDALAAIVKSPQQLAHLLATGDTQPGAPARAQSPWQPSGGEVCQGDDV